MWQRSQMQNLVLTIKSQPHILSLSALLSSSKHTSPLFPFNTKENSPLPFRSAAVCQLSGWNKTACPVFIWLSGLAFDSWEYNDKVRCNPGGVNVIQGTVSNASADMFSTSEGRYSLTLQLTNTRPRTPRGVVTQRIALSHTPQSELAPLSSFLNPCRLSAGRWNCLLHCVRSKNSMFPCSSLHFTASLTFPCGSWRQGGICQIILAVCQTTFKDF